MLKSITGVYIGEKLQPLCSADYMCNFFIVCFIFDGGPFPMEGGWVCVSSIFYYRLGDFVVFADAALSVSGRGTPDAHSLGSGGGGVKSG